MILECVIVEVDLLVLFMQTGCYFLFVFSVGDDALTTTLSAFYAKFLVILGIAFPVTDILSQKTPPSFYQGFYLYLYIGSVAFVVYMYAGHLRTRALFSMIDSYRKDFPEKIIKRGVTFSFNF